jgi:hypothetical protein
MSSAAWAASSAGIAVIVTCAVLLWLARRHERGLREQAGRVHERLSPWLYRALAFGMYVGSCTVALTALGPHVIGAEVTVVNFTAGLFNVGPGPVYDVSIGIGLVSLGVVVLGAWLEPGPAVAWWALALPFACALSGGHLHGVLTVFPVTEWSSHVAAWLGGRPGARG